MDLTWVKIPDERDETSVSINEKEGLIAFLTIGNDDCSSNPLRIAMEWEAFEVFQQNISTASSHKMNWMLFRKTIPIVFSFPTSNTGYASGVFREA